MKHIKGLDSLRAFAVLLVVLEHWWIPFDIDQKGLFYFWFKGIVPSGGFGVHLFFVLSGFLITLILLKAKSKNLPKRRVLKNFFIRRALRIFPVYYLTLIILVIFDYPFVTENLIYFSLYISNIQIYLTQSFNPLSHTWSLAVEEQFYLFWPWVILFINKQYLKQVFVIMVLVSLSITFYIVEIQQNWAGIVLMPACIQAFGIGGIYAYLKENNQLKHYQLFFKLILIGALVAYFFFSFNPDISSQFNYLNIFINSILSITLIHIVINKKRNSRIKNIFIENKLLILIGKISYGIYLFHYIIPFFYDSSLAYLIERTQLNIFRDIQDWKSAYPIKLILLFSLSYLSFRFFEKPILKLKKHYPY